MRIVLICLITLMVSPITAQEMSAVQTDASPLGVSVLPLDLDPGFAGDGTTEIQLRLNDYGAAGFVEPSGEIVVFGYSDNGSNGSNGEAVMLRLAADGTLGPLVRFGSQGFGCSAPRSFLSALRLSDGTYAGGGYVQTNCSGVPRFFNVLQLNAAGIRLDEYDHVVFNNQLAYIFGMAEQADGKVVAAGLISGSGFDATTFDFGVSRFLTDGTLDTGFGSGGTFTFDMDGDLDYANHVIVDRQGRILVAGFGRVNGSTDQDILVLGLTADGILDSAFGNGGVFRYDRAGFSDAASGIAQHVGGRIFVSASTRSTADTGEFVVLGLTEDGALDPAFATDGVAAIDLGAPVSGAGASFVTVGRSGRVYVTGSAEFGGSGLEFREAVVAVLQFNGLMDPSFNSGAVRTFAFGEQPVDLPQTIQVDDQESQILVTGHTENADRTTQRFGVARLIGIEQHLFDDSFESLPQN